MSARSDDDIYATVRTLLGLHGGDRRVGAFVRGHRGKLPSFAAGSGFASADLRRIGVRLLFWVGWGKGGPVGSYAVKSGTLVEAQFFQEGIERYHAFAGALPRGLHVDMSRDELTAALGAPSEVCDCGQEPPCFFAWHVREFDAPLEAHVTHHAKHKGRTRPRAGRVDICVHLPRVE
ncbi:MAG: hypothetical protein KC776_39185 [Myxococcales bacterium]|nr:hypothetical protein [Myxococcales bacterium]MCB9577854.1 hypothetical protein [Polyangiaceae bacterium]